MCRPTPTPPLLLQETLFPEDNPNLNNTGAVAFGENTLYALDTNNGLIAFSIKDPVDVGPAILDHPQIEGNNLTISVGRKPIRSLPNRIHPNI